MIEMLTALKDCMPEPAWDIVREFLTTLKAEQLLLVAALAYVWMISPGTPRDERWRVPK